VAAPLVLVGGGRMGGALLAGWLSKGGIAASEVVVVEPAAEAARGLRERHGVEVVDSAAALAPALAPSLVLFAVKPQVIGEVVGEYRKYAAAAPAPVFVSIAAGTRLSLFEGALPEAAVVRAMPNTPAAVGRGITVACANARVGADQIALCTRLLEAVGEVAWIDDEGDLDAVTAVSGSGPAYVFLLIECLAGAGVAAGLAPALAARLARATVTGAGELASPRSPAPANSPFARATAPRSCGATSPAPAAPPQPRSTC
jgi:pyrroline-5-carboxylate reductase